MRRRTTILGWPRCDPRYYRFAMPNAVWEYRLKPIGFVIFSYLCYHRTSGVLTPETIAVGVHMTVGTVEKYLDRLVDKKLINEDGTPVLCCMDEKFFTLPNEIFLLHLPPSAFLVYAYLLLIEDRQSHTCHPSYNTIAATTGLSRNTTIKSIGALLEMGLITVESSSYFDRHGLKWKGNNLYTILPVGVAMDAFYQRQLHRMDVDAARQKTQAKLSQLCAAQVPSSDAGQPTDTPGNAKRCNEAVRLLRGARRGTEYSRIKACRLDVAPLPTSARSAGSLRGTGVRSQTVRKQQIEVAQRRDPPAARLSDDVFGQKRRHLDG